MDEAEQQPLSDEARLSRNDPVKKCSIGMRCLCGGGSWRAIA